MGNAHSGKLELLPEAASPEMVTGEARRDITRQQLARGVVPRRLSLVVRDAFGNCGRGGGRTADQEVDDEAVDDPGLAHALLSLMQHEDMLDDLCFAHESTLTSLASSTTPKNTATAASEAASELVQCRVWEHVYRWRLEALSNSTTISESRDATFIRATISSSFALARAALLFQRTLCTAENEITEGVIREGDISSFGCDLAAVETSVDKSGAALSSLGFSPKEANGLRKAWLERDLHRKFLDPVRDTNCYLTSSFAFLCRIIVAADRIAATDVRALAFTEMEKAIDKEISKTCATDSINSIFWPGYKTLQTTYAFVQLAQRCDEKEKGALRGWSRVLSGVANSFPGGEDYVIYACAHALFADIDPLQFQRYLERILDMSNKTTFGYSMFKEEETRKAAEEARSLVTANGRGPCSRALQQNPRIACLVEALATRAHRESKRKRDTTSGQERNIQRKTC